MIDIKLTNSRDDNTNELLRMYKNNPGIYISNSINVVKVNKIREVVKCSDYKFKVDDTSFLGEDNIYLDNFTFQGTLIHDKFEQILRYDCLNRQFIIRGVIGFNKNYDKKFTEYLHEFFSEYLI